MAKILIAEYLDIDTIKKFEDGKTVFVHVDNFIAPDDSESELHFYYRPDYIQEDLEKEIADYDGLIVRPREVPEKIMKLGRKLKIIVRGGSGMNAIDVQAAKKLNIVVENTPGENSVSTAEYTFAFIMEVVANRNIIRCHNDVREKCFKGPMDYKGQELSKKKIAIIGMGNIGNHLARMCDGFGMDVSYYNRSKKNVPYKSYDSIEELLKAGPDIVSLNLPLVAATNQFFADDMFSLMKEGSILINTARPQLVNPESFGKALKSGALYSAAIDGDMDLIEPFIKFDEDRKCIFTNHIADATKQAQEKITNAAISQIIEYFKYGKLINAV